MSAGQPRLPLIWLLSDPRNDAQLEDALASLPPGSGFVFRHYHLAADERRRRFAELSRVAHDAGHCVVVAGDQDGLRGDGVYAAPGALGDAPGLRLATAHDAEEIQAAIAAKADGIFLSPVFATR
ncbi:thiamine phosphate synthase, partial [Qipengyuania sp.]|uniref:thiamine phosphate synthase n=1 Tax=Qipengyuania sp. TaxID=2004515 RepID=UPI0035C82119